MEEQWALFHSLCNPNDKDIERDTREQVLRRHIKPFEEQPDEVDATADHVMVWSAWAAPNGLKKDIQGLCPGFAKLYKVIHTFFSAFSPLPSPFLTYSCLSSPSRSWLL